MTPLTTLRTAYEVKGPSEPPAVTLAPVSQIVSYQHRDGLDLHLICPVCQGITRSHYLTFRQEASPFIRQMRADGCPDCQTVRLNREMARRIFHDVVITAKGDLRMVEA
jgi:hypothetical protein